MKNVGGILILFLISMSTISQAHARPQFLPGYIVDLKHDTIHGLIEYEEWTSNPEFIRFKPSNYRTPVEYDPIDIVAFGVLGKEFNTAIVQKEISPFRDSELEKDSKLNLIQDTVFLQTLVGGTKSLHYLKEWDDRVQFYIKEDTTYTLLLHKIYIEYTQNIRKEYHNMRFVGQLTRYLWDQPELLDEIADTYYSRPDLEALFQNYLKLSGQKTAYVNKDSNFFGVFGLVAGASVTMLEVETDYLKAGFGPSTNFTGGVSLDLAMNGRFRNWTLYNELLYSSYQAKNTYPGYFPASWAKFDFKYLKINTMARFQPSFFFLGAGISNGICIDYYGSKDDYRMWEIGLVLGAGVKFKHLTMELREDIGDGMSPFVGAYTNTKRFQILVGYSF